MEQQKNTDQNATSAAESTNEPTNQNTVHLQSQFNSNSTALQVVESVNLSGKYAIVTGASSGIGIETTRALALAGCHVVLACRDLTKGGKVVDSLKFEKSSVSVELMYIDLEKLVTVKKFAEEYLKKGYPLHFLVLNAGMYTASPFTITEDGFEKTFQINYLSHFYLANLLTEKLIASAPARIIVVSSDGHKFTSVSSVAKFTRENLSPTAESFWSLGGRHYGSTKLCNVFHAISLHKRLHDKGVSAFSIHPGVVVTEFTRNNGAFNFMVRLVKSFLKTSEQGAATSVYCCATPNLEKFSGQYFKDCAVGNMDSFAKNSDMEQKLWEMSENMIAEASAKFAAS